MLLSKKAFTKSSKHYLQYGYDISDKYIEVDIEHLMKGSHSKIVAKCDYCEIEKELSYKDYNKNTSINGKFSCSVKCGSLKSKETNFEKYGVESTNSLLSTKEKYKKTINEKYGVDHISQVDGIKRRKSEKMKLKGEEVSKRVKCYWEGVDGNRKKDINEKRARTAIEAYGVENISMLDSVKDKVRKTNFEKWGGYTFQSESLMEKVRKTNIERYGHTYSICNAKIKEKIEKTNIEKWGFKIPSMSDQIKEKTLKTNRDRYGVDNIMHLPETLQSLKKRLFDKYGVDSYFKTEEFKKSKRGMLLQDEDWRKSNLILAKDKNYIRYVSDHHSEFKCDRGLDHTFEISSDLYFSRTRSKNPLCTVCYEVDTKSIKEKELMHFIAENYGGSIVENYRDGIEIDIYMPDIKLGIEFNGLYWHSEKFRKKNYHLAKKVHFEEKEIRIFNVWEDDWILKCEIVKSQIKNLLGKTEKRLYARKCEIKEIKEARLVRDFLDANHIQGYVKSVVKLGMYADGELVAIMLFDDSEGRSKMGKGEWNLARFCNKANMAIAGAASKMLNYFVSRYRPSRIISYADMDWSNGELYEKIGFNMVGVLKPDYKYLVQGKRINKQRYTKKRLAQMSGVAGGTESQMAKSLGMLKVYNCGKIKYEMNL